MPCSQEVPQLQDGQSVHIQCSYVPKDDDDLKVEWSFEGKEISNSSRIKTIADFGFVMLDILQMDSKESGTYTCRIFNKYGNTMPKLVASSRCSLSFQARRGYPVCRFELHWFQWSLLRVIADKIARQDGKAKAIQNWYRLKRQSQIFVGRRVVFVPIFLINFLVFKRCLFLFRRRQRKGNHQCCPQIPDSVGRFLLRPRRPK